MPSESLNYMGCHAFKGIMLHTLAILHDRWLTTWRAHLPRGVAAERYTHELGELCQEFWGAVQHIHVPTPVATLAQISLGC